ncbi:MAG: FAD-dependent oxidoreductase, partial [Candidatus Nealsonbacteria bacterium]|nr:FAD-dependent oxidoreductase [Candidatus Nealsonbacteria bacterium]
KKVTIIEAQSEIARDLELISKIALIKKGGLLEKYGINVITNTSVTEIGKGEVVIKDKTGEQRNIRADSVVIAVGRKPLISEELISEAKKISQEVYVIGDAKGPRKVIDAIHEGFSVAIDIK